MFKQRLQIMGWCVAASTLGLPAGCPGESADSVESVVEAPAVPPPSSTPLPPAPTQPEAPPTDAATTTTAPEALPPTPAPPQPPAPGAPAPTEETGTPFSLSAMSISSVAGGPRSDPEGVAPTAAQTTLLTWRDSRGRARTMTLGAYLYEYNFSFHDGANEVSRTANDDAWGHEGFGYVVSHNTLNGNSPLGKANPATKIETVVFSGGHHAIYRVEMLYDRDREGGGNGIKIPVVIEWMVATGRDHPVWAVNWRSGAALNAGNVDFNVYRMDTRGPYGALNFDGAPTRNAGDAIGAIAWGDFGLRFATLDAQLTLQSPWVYDLPNRVPFVYANTATVNAEMGIVRTLAGDKQMGNPDRVYGRERGSASNQVFTDRGDCSAFGDNRVYSMPCVNGWPYQLMNYDWDPATGKPPGEATGTKLLAWGTPYGWLGASSFDLFDYSGTADGRGDRGYATFVVLGPKGRYNPTTQAFDQPGDVALQLQQVEALADTAITNITRGAPVTELPRGPLSTTMRGVANGYDDIYAAHHVRAAEDGVEFTLTPAGIPLKNPVLVIENYTATRVPRVFLDGVELRVNTDADAGAYVSLDESGRRLWVTIARTLPTATRVRVER